MSLTSNMVESMNCCLMAAMKLCIISLVENTRQKGWNFFTMTMLKGTNDCTSNTQALSTLQELEENSRQMIRQDFGPLRSLHTLL